MRLALTAFVACLPLSAPAQTLPCAARERVLGFVIDQHGQARLATGQAANGASIELFANADGAWTLLLNLPDGRSCLMANGQGFQANQGLQPARGNPA